LNFQQIFRVFSSSENWLQLSQIRNVRKVEQITKSPEERTNREIY